MNPCILAVAIFLAAPGGEIALPAGTPVSSTDSEHLLFDDRLHDRVMARIETP